MALAKVSTSSSVVYRFGVTRTPAIATTLWDTARIIVTPIVHDEYAGVRVTPNLYTTLDEVDTFASAMERLKPTEPPARSAG